MGQSALRKLLLLASAFAGPVLGAEVHPAKVDRIVAGMSLVDKLNYLGGTGFSTKPMPALGLPPFIMADGAMGIRVDDGPPTNAYAAGIGLAASWDQDLAHQIGASIGREARAHGVHFLLAPGVNMARTPLGGRNFEYFGEDPYLTARMAVGYIEGVQSQGVSATIKHFVGNDSDFNRHTTDSIIDERTLREIYLPPFEAAVREARVGAVITGYNLLNGVPMSQNARLNETILRGEWGFSGVVMTDWAAGSDSLRTFTGGIDLDMPRGDWMSAAKLAPFVQDGRIDKGQIDAKVRHILDPALRFGWLDRPQQLAMTLEASAQAEAVALRSARESAVLVKNDGATLPLDLRKLRTILVVGPLGDSGEPTGGGSGSVTPGHTVSLVEGLRKIAGPDVRILFDRGVSPIEELVRATNFTQDEQGAVPGLRVETFATVDPVGTPSAVTTREHIDEHGVPWSDYTDNPKNISHAFATARKTKRSHRWSGYYRAADAGNYQLILWGSGESNGVRVTVDGRLIVDTWYRSSAYESDRTLALSKGPHRVVVEDSQTGALGGRVELALVPTSSLVSPAALAAAGQADAVIAAVGFDHRNEGEGSDREYGLPAGQEALIQAVAARNPKTVVIVTAGGPVDMSPWQGNVPATILGWYGGQAGGTALAELLTGAENPSGHLPLTIAARLEDYPAIRAAKADDGIVQIPYREGVFAGYRGFPGTGPKPLYPFGFGLSYTSFRLNGLRMPAIASATKPDIAVSFTVANTGQRAGATVAQLYVTDGHAPVARPERELKGFARVFLKPGEVRRVTLKLDRRAFAYYDVGKRDWAVAPGRFTVRVGLSSADDGLAAPVLLR